MKYDNFVFYGDIMNSLEELPDEETKAKVALAILRYGTSGEWTDDNLYCRLILPLVKPGIDNAKTRYAAAVENGKKGGRKPTIDKEKVKELKAQGLTNKQVAEELNCSISSVEKINAELRKNAEGEQVTTRKNQKNLNINKNININNNKNKEEKESFFLATPEKAATPQREEWEGKSELKEWIEKTMRAPSREKCSGYMQSLGF